MCEIERILRRGASTPHTGYDKGKVEGHRLEIQEILSTINAPSLSLSETPDVDGRATSLAPIDTRPTTPLCESGMSSSPILYGISIAPYFSKSDPQPADV